MKIKLDTRGQEHCLNVAITPNGVCVPIPPLMRTSQPGWWKTDLAIWWRSE